MPLQWRHNGHDGVSNQRPHHSLLSRLFRGRSKKTSKFRVTGLCAGNSPVTVEVPAQMASNAEKVSIWRRHHAFESTVDHKWRRFLTGRNRVMHICIITGSDNGLSPVRCQAIVRMNVGLPFGTNFSAFEYKSRFLTKMVHLKISSAKCRQFCLGFNVS